jgi:tetraacyldisaccharide 4'-kinase
MNGHRREECADFTAGEQNAIEFNLIASEVERLNGSLARPIERFSGTTVHGVAAIGNPARFFDMLRSHGIQVIEHAFRDHAALAKRDLEFGDDFNVLMTEKDAVKLGHISSDKYWAVPVDMAIDAVEAGPWMEQIESRLRSEMESK